MKNFKLKYLIIALISFGFLTACDDDGDDNANKYEGNYVITSATVSAVLTIPTTIGEIDVPAGTDITEVIQTALLGAVDCTPENSLIELRADKSLYLSCNGTTEELNAGTWDEVDETTIKLNMNGAAVPGSDVGFVLTVSDIELAGSTLTGTTSVPLPASMLGPLVELLSQGMLSISPTVIALPVEFTITLTKQ